MWLAAPGVPAVPGGVLIVTPNQALPGPWQVAQVTADTTAGCPAADRAGVVLSLNRVPVMALVEAWQPTQSAEPTGIWLAVPEVPTVPGGCTGCPPVPCEVPENGPLPEPWQAVQVSAVTAECTMIDLPTPNPAAWQGVQAGAAPGSGMWVPRRWL